ncbi:MAG TPA: hypothetical protein VN836_10005 [Verrucomicrobiae bacterium]|nr:hypothetical protein [Verrucomicrobiae bacterium]
MLVSYYKHGGYFSRGSTFIQRNALVLSRINRTVVWNTGAWNKSANHPFDTIEIIQGSHFHSQRNYYADERGYPFIVRGVASGLLDQNLLNIFGVEYLQKHRTLKIRNLLVDGGDTLLIPEIRTANPGKTFQPFFEGLRELLARNPKIKKLVFRGGGNVVIPEDLRWWCLGNRIEIQVLSADRFDAAYPNNPIEDGNL